MSQLPVLVAWDRSARTSAPGRRPTRIYIFLCLHFISNHLFLYLAISHTDPLFPFFLMLSVGLYLHTGAAIWGTGKKQRQAACWR